MEMDLAWLWGRAGNRKVRTGEFQEPSPVTAWGGGSGGTLAPQTWSEPQRKPSQRRGPPDPCVEARGGRSEDSRQEMPSCVLVPVPAH